MIAIIDYGVGNLFSLQCSLNKIGEKSVVTSDFDKILTSDGIILPGVGAFADAAKKLTDTGLDKVVKYAQAENKPLLGICLGMQLMFDKSHEYGTHQGLALFPGEIIPLCDSVKNHKIPHMGWNCLKLYTESRLYKYTKEGDFVYFVHSYHAKTDDKYITAVVDYEGDVVASVECGNTFATQYHPEKSGKVGLKILKAFCEINQ